MKETLRIDGMTCGGCVNGVQRALGQLPLKHLAVGIGQADIEYDESKVTHKEIVRTIAESGYQVVEGPSSAK